MNSECQLNAKGRTFHLQPDPHKCLKVVYTLFMVIPATGPGKWLSNSANQSYQSLVLGQAVPWHSVHHSGKTMVLRPILYNIFMGTEKL